MSAPPRVIVCVGGGGVGKTSTSAALAIALARRGARALIVTIDPARRLAGAMGVALSDTATPIALEGARGTLTALMPDPRRSAATFVEILFADEPEARARILDNRLYQGLADAAAGVHEIVAMSLIAHASESGLYDVIVIDTAPSRNAMDFVTYPSRLTALLGGKVMTFFANFAANATANATASVPRRRGFLARIGDRFGGQVESLVAGVVGPNLLRDTASLFGELAIVRPRFVALTARASALLLGPAATYLLVSAPTAAARDDAVYLHERIKRIGQRPSAILMNLAAAQGEGDDWLDALEPAPDSDAPLDAVILALKAELTARRAATAAARVDLARRLPRLPIVSLPVVESPAPEEVVAVLSEVLDGQLAALGLDSLIA